MDVHPVEGEWKNIEACLNQHTCVGLCGPPGSGKTLCLPDILWNQKKGAILLVESTRFAAERLIESFVSRRKWKPSWLHLRSGMDENNFFTGRHFMSIITYGMLWQWISSGSEHRIQISCTAILAFGLRTPMSYGLRPWKDRT